MDMTEYATWHVDDVSLAILSTLDRDNVEAIAADLDHDTPFI